MEKRARTFLVVLSLIFLAFAILNCSKKPIPAPIGTSSDLKKYSLTATELPDFSLVFESKLGKNEMSPNAVYGYAADFANKVTNTSSPNYKSISINLQAYNSAEDAKKDFSINLLPKEILDYAPEVKTNSPIGDESFVYYGNRQRKVYVFYRIENAAVQLTSTGIGANSTIRYARLIESKFNPNSTASRVDG